jgi:hypothetical protein
MGRISLTKCGFCPTSTGRLMLSALPSVRAGDHNSGRPIPMTDVEVLSPITPNQQYLCQAINYQTHMAESGFKPDTSPYNMTEWTPRCWALKRRRDGLNPREVPCGHRRRKHQGLRSRRAEAAGNTGDPCLLKRM